MTNFESAYGLAKYKNARLLEKLMIEFYFNQLLVKNLQKFIFFSFFNFTSQIGNGYKYSKDSDNNEIRELTTRILSPHTSNWVQAFFGKR